MKRARTAAPNVFTEKTRAAKIGPPKIGLALFSTPRSVFLELYCGSTLCGTFFRCDKSGSANASDLLTSALESRYVIVRRRSAWPPRRLYALAVRRFVEDKERGGQGRKRSCRC